MAKTLVIQNADFSANKVTTVSFGTVPCTGIELEESSYSLTNYTPVTVGCTVTPENTTDTVTWESSDTDVVTVSNGVITAVGLGSATITANCGSFSDTATVTVSIAYVPSFTFASISRASEKTYVTAAGLSMARLSGWGSGSQKAQHNFVASSGGDIIGDIVYPILIPKGTKSVRINYGSGQSSNFYNDATSGVWWVSDTACGDTNFPNAATYVSGRIGFNPRSGVPFTTNVPEGANALAFVFQLNSSQAEGTNANTLAETLGITLEFLSTTVS